MFAFQPGFKSHHDQSAENIRVKQVQKSNSNLVTDGDTVIRRQMNKKFEATETWCYRWILRRKRNEHGNNEERENLTTEIPGILYEERNLGTFYNHMRYGRKQRETY